jgi:hypothetical protein
MLPDQIHDAPSSVALLEVRKRQVGGFRSPESASQEHR